MPRRVAVIAGGVNKWGVRKATQKELIQEAGKIAFDDCPNLKPKDVEGVLCATSCSERFSFQTHIAPMVAESLGIKPTRLCAHVELLCGSGSAAVQLAYGHIAGGLSDVVMVVGVEKVYLPSRWETNWNLQFAYDPDDLMKGIGGPAILFAMAAKQHMKTYGTTEEQLARVSFKNRRNGAKNPNAHFTKETTMEKILSAKPVVPPLKLFDCCPLTDGAAAVVLASEEKAKEFTDKPVYIIGAGQASTHMNLANVPNWTTWENVRIASRNAYQMADIEPKDVDVVEIHDCFSISEIIQYESLGLCPVGEGGRFAEDGKSDFGGEVVVNPSGGLLSFGHPFGATGVRQAVEVMHQLRGDANNQVPNAKIGLTHNISGALSASTVNIFGCM